MSRIGEKVSGFQHLTGNDQLNMVKDMSTLDVEKFCVTTPEINRFCVDNENELWLWFLERDFRVDPVTVPPGRAREKYQNLVIKGVKSSFDVDEFNNKDYEIKEIVELVIDGDVDIDAIEISKDINKEDLLKITKDPVDETRPLKDIATDIVVNEFFQTNDTLFRFLEVVYTTFETALDMYGKMRGISQLDLFFLYKGGNILRIVSSEFLLELPSSATREINKFYAPFFKRSDADFTIYINPNVKNYDEIFHELTVLSYLLQNYLRELFSSDPEYYFDFPRFKEDYQRKLLKPYFEKFNEAEGFENSFADIAFLDTTLIGKKSFYKRNPDITLRFFENVTFEELLRTPYRMASRAPISDDTSGFMTITHNDSLDFPNGKGTQRIKFNLTRTKIFFTLLQKGSNKTTNVGGELIDVSISHKDDSNTAHFFEYVNDYVTRYVLRSEKNVLDFNSYELVYLIEDLENILFFQRDKPWDDRKYGKRINRLFYLDFVDIFMRIDSSFGRIEILRDVRDLVFAPLRKAENLQELRAAKEGIDKFLERHGDRELYINSLLLNLNILIDKTNDEDQDEMLEMADLLWTNANVVIETIQNIRQYCSIDGKVEKSDIIDANIKTLL